MAEPYDFRTSIHQQPHRLLEDDEYNVGSTGDVLKNTFMIYGSIFAALFLFFLFARKRYPRVYNVRNSVPELRCALAEDTLGTLRWIYRVFFVPEEDMYDQCGLDAVVYLRMLRYGMRVAFMIMLNSIYLMPIYATSPKSNDVRIDDNFEKVTLGNVPEKDNRVFAAVVAAYIIFGYAMYLLFKEFRWFTQYRHDFLTQARPDNYSVYVSGIPPEYRSNESLLAYFREVYYGGVLEARVALNLKNLESDVAERTKIVSKLEHAINVLNVKRKRPTHKAKKEKSKCCGKGEKVDSIYEYKDQLEEYNEKISKTITRIEETDDKVKKVRGDYNSDFNESMKSDFFLDAMDSASDLTSPDNDKMESVIAMTDSNETNPDPDNEGGDKDVAVKSHASSFNGNENGKDEKKKTITSTLTATGVGVSTGIASTLTATGVGVSTGIATTITATRGGVSTGIATAISAAGEGATAVTSAAKMLLGTDDGIPLDAGFVTFSSLRARASALQMIHHETPFTMVVRPAPLPKDIFWGNVGLTHKAQQLSYLLGQSLTVVLCVFWAVPVTFISSLSNIETLKKEIPFLGDLINSAPWLEDVLTQLAPLLLRVLVALLPVFLMILAKMEGHVSTGRLMAVFFIKLCVFNIIHTFLIVTISGSVFESIQDIANDPSSIVEMLASSIPAQASFFIQYSLVQTFISMGLEITRIVAIVKAFLRSKIGPNLTEKERNTPFLGLAPLSVPEEFGHAESLADLILFFLILFVYSVMSPIMAFVQAFAFGVTGMVYRHQFIYIYPKSNDSGGQLWAQGVKIIIACMFIAQLTLWGVLGLKKSPRAVIMLIPLVVITALFTAYLKQQHYIVTNFLPSIGAIKVDKKHVSNDFDFDFLKEQYRQPALQEKRAYPENMPPDVSEYGFEDNFVGPEKEV